MKRSSPNRQSPLSPDREPGSAPGPSGGVPTTALSHTNRKGVCYYLHEGRTKTGKPRYFVARDIGHGALDTMPDGYEFTESVNAVVSVRRIASAESSIPATDVKIVEQEIARHRHLDGYLVERRGDALIIHQPSNTFHDTAFEQLETGRGGAVERAARSFAPVRYEPVFRFVRHATGQYEASRWSYRGEGRWWPLIEGGNLKESARRYLRLLGTDDYFDLI